MQPIHRIAAPLSFILCASLWSCAAPQAASAPAVEESAVREGLNDRFLAEDLVVDDWIGRFEVEAREIALRRNSIAAALELSPGDAVADVGAGTGLFVEPFADAVGSGGKLYCVEISPRFADHLRERAQEEGRNQVEVVLCTEKDSKLPANSVDVVFICDTYHHFTYPRTTLDTLYRALRPGGSLVIVEFERIPGVSRDWVLGHVRAGKEEFRSEIEKAGFTFKDEVDVGLSENYLIRFTR